MTHRSIALEGLDEARDVAARMPPCRERTALDTALAEVERLTRVVEDLHIQYEAATAAHRAEVGRLTRERDAARIACDGCADAEARTGRAHYADCPVSLLIAERDRLAAALAEVRTRAKAVVEKTIGRSTWTAFNAFVSWVVQPDTDLAVDHDARMWAEGAEAMRAEAARRLHNIYTRARLPTTAAEASAIVEVITVEETLRAEAARAKHALWTARERRRKKAGKK